MSKALLAGADFSALPKTGNIIVAFSGGADSVTLAHSLLSHAEPSRVILAHVNHMLRGDEADRDQNFAETFAKKYGLRFSLLRADVNKLSKERGMGSEECGRQIRYEFFKSLATGKNDCILTAHNANDNAETVLMNLSRGAALSGLCGIPRVRDNIFRPLLSVSREEIEEYCKVNNLYYVTDSTNLTDEYTRNRIRHRAVPVLKEINPGFEKAVSRTCGELSEIRDFISSESEKLLRKAERGGVLSRHILKEAHRAVLFEAFVIYAKNVGCGSLEFKHLEELQRVLEKGGAAELPGRYTARCAQDWFYISREGLSEAFCVKAEEEENLLPGGKRLILKRQNAFSLREGKDGEKIYNLVFKNCLDYDKITSDMFARTRRAGDSFIPAGRGVRKKLKQLFQENNVPVSLREEAVLLICSEEIAYCEGIGVSEAFKAGPDTENFLTVEILLQKNSEGK